MATPHIKEIADLCQKCGLTNYPDTLLSDLMSRYSEPHRHYHTVAHVSALLSQLQTHGLYMAAAASTIVLAILYHDAIYDTRRSDNEQRSAELARSALASIDAPTPVQDKVVDMILATQHHQPPADDADTNLLLDLDLSVLAAKPEDYDAYSSAIRREYEWVSDGGYAKGRSEVLGRFLQRDVIFRTSALRALWEAPARINLARELTSLSSRR